MDRPKNQPRLPSALQKSWLLLVPGVTGCSSYIEVGGAYFPAWLLSLILGSTAGATLRTILVRKGIDSLIEPHALAWPSIIVALSAAFWLVFFSQ